METHFIFISRAMTLAEVADALGISRSQVSAHVRDGTLQAIDVGRGAVRRDLRVEEDDLEAFKRARRVATPPVPRLAPRAARNQLKSGGAAAAFVSAHRERGESDAR